MKLINRYFPGGDQFIDPTELEEVLGMLLRLEDTVFGIIHHYLQIHLHLETQGSHLYHQGHPGLEQLVAISRAVGPLVAFSTKGIQMDDVTRLQRYQDEQVDKRYQQSQAIIDYRLKENELVESLGDLDQDRLKEHIYLFQSEYLRYWNQRGEGWLDSYVWVRGLLYDYEWLLRRLDYLDGMLLAMNYKQEMPSDEGVNLFLDTLYDLETGEVRNYFELISADFKL